MSTKKLQIVGGIIPQPDWNQTDTTQHDYIKNKPVVDQTFNNTSTNAQSGVAISGVISNFMKYKGEVQSYANLPSTANEGDTYLVQEEYKVGGKAIGLTKSGLDMSWSSFNATGPIYAKDQIYCEGFGQKLFGCLGLSFDVSVNTTFTFPQPTNINFINANTGEVWTIVATEVIGTSYPQYYTESDPEPAFHYYGIQIRGNSCNGVVPSLGGDYSDEVAFWLLVDGYEPTLNIYDTFIDYWFVANPAKSLYVYKSNNWVCLDSAELIDGTVSTNKIQDRAITTEKIKDLAIGTSQINTNAITSYKIQDGAVTSAKVGSLPTSKITSGTFSVLRGGTGKSSWTTNKLIYPSSTTVLTQLNFPTEQSVLTQSTSGAPYWTSLSALISSGGSGSSYKRIGYSSDCDYVVSGTTGGAAAFTQALSEASNGDTILVEAGHNYGGTATVTINKNVNFIGINLGTTSGHSTTLAEIHFPITVNYVYSNSGSSRYIPTFSNFRFKGILKVLGSTQDYGNSEIGLNNCIVDQPQELMGQYYNCIFNDSWWSGIYVGANYFNNCRFNNFGNFPNILNTKYTNCDFYLEPNLATLDFNGYNEAMEIENCKFYVDPRVTSSFIIGTEDAAARLFKNNIIYTNAPVQLYTYVNYNNVTLPEGKETTRIIPYSQNTFSEILCNA